MRGREGYDFLSLGLLGASFVTPVPARLFGHIFCRQARGLQGFSIVCCRIEVVFCRQARGLEGFGFSCVAFLLTGVWAPRFFEVSVTARGRIFCRRARGP